MTDLVDDAIERLRAAGIDLAPGLDSNELGLVEQRFGVTFGPEHRRLLATALPTGPRWIDWRHGSADEIRARLSWPTNGVVFDVHDNGFWPASWGERPTEAALAERTARTRLSQVPQLLPIYGHRYLTTDPRYAPSPVFSVYQTDVIYYGDNLLDYVAHEFTIPPRHPSPRRPHVPFWSDLAVGAEGIDL